MGKGVEAETGCQCNPNAFADEDVVATVKAAGGEPAFWGLAQVACRWAELQQRNVRLCHVFLLLSETNPATA